MNGRVDEFALTLTFRLISRSGATEGEPVIQRCTGRWGARSSSWRAAAGCRHYAPASTLRMIMRSGGGFVSCAFRRTPPLVMAWIVPPRGARWLVVERSTGYAVAYPVTRREPINVTHLERDVRWQPEPWRARFPYAIVDRDGDVRRTSFLAGFAG